MHILLKKALIIVITTITLFPHLTLSQCTSISSGNWDDPSIWNNCGGTYPLNNDAIVSHTIDVNNNDAIDLTGNVTVQNGGTINWGDSKSNWTGNLTIETGGVFNANRANTQGYALTGDMFIFGTMNINAEYDVDGSASIETGGTLDLDAKLKLGASTGCGYTLTIETGATLLGANASDRLDICGVVIASGGGSCNNINDSPDPGPSYCIATISGLEVLGESGKITPLKVKFVNVSISEMNKTKINWLTSWEENSSHFIVEGSKAGTSFEPIEYVPSTNQNSGTDYQADIDNSFSYFRITEVDFDGSLTRSKIIYHSTSLIKFYPNPIQDILNIELDTPCKINICTIKGQLIMSKHCEELDYIDLSYLKSGVYSLNYSNKHLIICKE